MQVIRRICHRTAFLTVLAVLFQFVLACRAADGGSVDSKDEQVVRGKPLFMQACAPCHQLQGQGTPGAFPPLAGSDFLAANRERVIRGLCEGLTGLIEVKGVSYNGFMPPAVLSDQQLADVVTYVLNSWDNPGGSVSANEVKRVRAKTEFKTYEASLKGNEFQPLPQPPEGWTLREVAQMPGHVARLTGDGKGKTLYALCINGDVWRVDIATGTLKQILWGARYINLKHGDPLTTGFVLDSQNRLWIACNQRETDTIPNPAEVTIFRTTATEDGEPADPKPWFVTHYPWGTGNHHGVNYIGFGPDGALYVSSGSRTDGNDPALNDPNIAHVGEVPLTACLWRFDPKDDHPTEPEIYARGLRNTYGICWNDKGEMFGTENGPNADAPEELNLIEKGRHYGFPYKFSNWEKKVYPYSPTAPPGLEFTLPIPNLGPDACMTGDGKPLYTFDPHSSPAGIVFLRDDFPPDYRGTFLVVRFGLLISQPHDYGFDLLQVRLQKDATGKYAATVKTMLAPLARPLDVLLSGRGKVYISEYTRTLRLKDSMALPGRILELAVKQPTTNAER
jgi:glucose/arabinose dehydrogenase/mono/diheme cytochrome c family protein